MLRVLALASLLLTMTFSAASANAAADPPVHGLTAHFEACPFSADGGSCAQPETAEVWIAPGDGRFAFWHEVGHVFDHQALTDEHRAWFTRLFRFPADTSWFLPDDEYDRRSFGRAQPGEVFADAFAACWLRRSPAGKRRGRRTVVNWTTAYDYYPSVRRHRRACNAIAVLGLLHTAA